MADRLAPRVLRWAVLQQGHVTDDRTARRPESLTLAALGLDNELGRELGLPKGFTLVEHRRGKWALRLLPGMRGQVTLAEDAPPLSLESVLSQGELALTEQSKGRINLGPVTVLFQFSRPRAAPARVALPSAARGSFLSSMDHTFAAIVVGFLFVEFGGAFALSRRQVVEVEELDIASLKLPDRFSPVEIRLPKTAKQPEPKKDEPGKEATKQPAASPAPSPKPALTQRDIDRLKQDLAKRGTLGALHSLNGELEQVATAAIGNDDAAKAIGQSLEGAKTNLNAGDPNGVLNARKDTGPETTTIGALDPGQVQGELKQRKRDANPELPPGGGGGGVVIDEPEVPVEQLDPAKIAAFVKRNLPAIQHCYEQELKRDRSLAGRVVVRFVITPAGGISAVDIDEDKMGSDAVDRCLQRTIKRWNLGLHPKDEAPVVYPFIFAPTGS